MAHSLKIGKQIDPDHSYKTLLYIGNHIPGSGKYSEASEEIALRIRERGWKINLTPWHKQKLLRVMGMLYTIFGTREKYALAIIDVFSGSAFCWAYLSGWLLKRIQKPFILVLRGGNLPDFCEKNKDRVLKLFGWAYGITSPSNYLRETLSEYDPNIQLISNGIDIKDYPYNMREKPRAQVIWLRAFHKIYNPSLAPRMLAELRNMGIEAQLTMIGPDKEDGSLQDFLQVADKLGVQEKIRIITGVSKAHVPEELSKGDIFLNTTNIDNTPVSVIEAMACGLCIVSTSVGGIPYLLENNKDALLVPPNDPVAMAVAVRRILTEPGFAGSLSTNARHKAEQYDWSAILPQWEFILERANGQDER